MCAQEDVYSQTQFEGTSDLSPPPQLKDRKQVQMNFTGDSQRKHPIPMIQQKLENHNLPFLLGLKIHLEQKGLSFIPHNRDEEQ